MNAQGPKDLWRPSRYIYNITMRLEENYWWIHETAVLRSANVWEIVSGSKSDADDWLKAEAIAQNYIALLRIYEWREDVVFQILKEKLVPAVGFSRALLGFFIQSLWKIRFFQDFKCQTGDIVVLKLSTKNHCFLQFVYSWELVFMFFS